MKQPLITIIAPTYNHKNYIAESVGSVLYQTYQNWEMIIIDDYSKDNTYEIAEEYARKDSRIKIIRHKENYGALNLDKIYNEALSIAKGEWIAILEGDDVWPNYKLERQVNTVKNLPEDIVLFHGNIGYIHEDIKKVTVQKLRVSLSKINLYKTPYDAFEYLVYGFSPVYSQTVIIKKEALLKVGGFIQEPREIMVVDFPTWLRLSRIGKFYSDNYILGFWRRHGSSITMNNQDKIAINDRIAIEEFLKQQNLNDILYNECFGKLQYFGAIVLKILKKDFDTAKIFLNELYECINSKKLSIDKASKLKLWIYEIAIFLKQPLILNYLYKFKRTKLDTVIYDYKPFFFKEEEFIKKLNSFNLMLSEKK